GRSDELGRLADTFVRAAQLAGQLGELRQKDQERRELVASMSHDLRTPLAALRGFLETMQRKADTLPANEQQHFLDTALRQTEKVSRLAQELFELAKLECDDASLSPEPFNLAELLQDVAQKYRLQAEQRGVSLQAELRPDLPLVSADIGLIERLLTNMIDNALRHTPPGGRVRLDAWPARGRITVAVRDTGIGIAPEYLPTLCDWDSPLARRARADGGGFGLIVVGKIAQLHGGRLQVESSLGVGSEFRFDLPLAESARAATDKS
ncbi:sensor histidine kinase, partial [Methylomonas koyamae]